jgi:hypothetical protein
MISSPILTRMHLEQALTPEQLRILAVIRIALMLGGTLFLLMVLFLYSIRTPDSLSNPDPDLMDTFSFTHIVFAVASIITAFIFSKFPLRKDRLFGQTATQSSDQLASQAVNLYRVSSLLLIVPIEGVAFFGSVICLEGVMNGTMTLYPVYWLNAATTGLLVFIGLATFPTRERVLTTLEAAFVL